MRHPAPHIDEATAAGARARLRLLLDERREAQDAGLGSNRVFMASLDHDIEVARATYVGLAVTEIATLRGLLDRRQAG